MLKKTFWCFFLGGVFALTPCEAKPQLLNGTAAKVGGTSISIEDVYIFRTLQLFMTVEDFKNNKIDLLQEETGKKLIQSVQKLIFETMVLKEIEKFSITTLSKAEATKRLKSQVQKSKKAGSIWNQILAKYQISYAQALRMVWRNLQAQQFVQKKVDTLTPIITQSEVDTYLSSDSQAARLSGPSLQKYRANTVLKIKREKVEKGLDEWIKYLRERYGVTSYLES